MISTILSSGHRSGPSGGSLRRFATIILAALMAVALATSAPAQDSQPPAPPPAAPPDSPPPAEGADEPVTLVVTETQAIKAMMEEMKKLRDELLQLRNQLAQARLEATQNQRELEELRQFVRDHHEFGDDFTRYQAVKEQAERDAKQREAQQARARREAEKAERDARRRELLAGKAARDARAESVARYRRQGFAPLGLDVFAGKMAFFYESKDSGERTRVDYDPFLGHYLRPLAPTSQVDYSKMTISGSVLNAADEVRNIGVAITFFDDNGNQVGHEIVQVNNARPNVPYPFTSTLDMALNRAFDSSSIYVLYADPAELDEANSPEAPAAPPEKDQPSRYGPGS